MNKRKKQQKKICDMLPLGDLFSGTELNPLFTTSEKVCGGGGGGGGGYTPGNRVWVSDYRPIGFLTPGPSQFVFVMSSLKSLVT